MANFPTWICACESLSSSFLDLLIFTDPSICSTVSFPLIKSDHVVLSVSIVVPQTKIVILFCTTKFFYHSQVDRDSLRDHLRDISVQDIFKAVLLLLLQPNFISRPNLELMYLSLIVNIRLNLIHLHDFQLLVLLQQPKQTTLLFCTNRINLQNLSKSLIIIAEGFLNLSNLLMLIKQKSLSFSVSLALLTFGEAIIMFSANLNLLYFLYLMALRCCLQHLIN